MPSRPAFFEPPGKIARPHGNVPRKTKSARTANVGDHEARAPLVAAFARTREKRHLARRFTRVLANAATGNGSAPPPPCGSDSARHHEDDVAPSTRRPERETPAPARRDPPSSAPWPERTTRGCR